MKFILNPSLEHMTLVKIVISLWSENDVRDLIMKHSSENLYSKTNWKTIEERVIENVSQLSLPQSLKEKVVDFIKPVGIEISMWMEYSYKYLPAHPPNKLFWTPQGTVDRKRTVEMLIGNDILNVVTGFRLACDYCLENDIIRFWNRLPDNLKYYDWHNSPVISFWLNNMNRRGAGQISYIDVFFKSFDGNNKVAAKYFLQKLTPQEREYSLKVVTKHKYSADVLCFLLPEMEEQQQRDVFKNNPCRVLQYFLQWPWQSFFIGVANCMWDFLSSQNYGEIMGDIIGKVRDGYKDYNYQKLFGEFWQKSPSDLKDSFTNRIDHSLILESLFDIKDKENIRLILKDASVTEKKSLIYSDEIDDYLTRFVWANEWDFLEFCIRECLPSKDELLKFKEEFEKRSPYTKQHLEKNKDKWSQIFCLSDDLVWKYNKRIVEEGGNSSSKRFQKLQ